MKFTPKKVFILENRNYKEIPYGEHQTLRQTDERYKEKFFLFLHGVLMEVTKETYKSYYKDKNRQRYIDECSRKRGDVSYNALDTDETLGENILADKSVDIEKQLEDKTTRTLLRTALKSLSSEERKLLNLRFYRNLSYNKIAKICGASRMSIYKKMRKIYEKLKKIMRN